MSMVQFHLSLKMIAKFIYIYIYKLFIKFFFLVLINETLDMSSVVLRAFNNLTFFEYSIGALGFIGFSFFFTSFGLDKRSY